MSDEKRPEGHEGDDFVTVGPNLGGGVYPAIRHRADHTIEFGTAHDIGHDLPPDALYLEQRHDNVYDVKPMVKGGSDNLKGPAKVNSPAFRTGWEHTFGGTKAPIGQA